MLNNNISDFSNGSFIIFGHRPITYQCVIELPRQQHLPMHHLTSQAGIRSTIKQGAQMFGY